MRATSALPRAHLCSRRSLLFVVAVLVISVLLDFALLVGKVEIDGRYEGVGTMPMINAQSCTEAFVLTFFFSQILLVAAWTTLFPGTSGLRLLAGTAVVAAATFFLSALSGPMPLHGTYLRQRYVPGDHWEAASEALLLVAMCLIIFYVVQAPYWLLRRILRARIVYDPGGRLSAPPRRPLSIVELLTATAFLAIPLLLARVVFTDGVMLRAGVLIAALALCLSMSLLGIPYLWAMLGTRRFLLGAVAVAALSEIVALIGGPTYMWIESRIPVGRWPLVFVAFQCVAASALLFAVGYGLLARAVGYRLVWSVPWNKSPAREVTPAISPTAAEGSTPL